MKEEATIKMIEYCVELINNDESLSIIQEMIMLKRIELAKPKKRVRKALDLIDVKTNY
jgi:hypothetical protein